MTPANPLAATRRPIALGLLALAGALCSPSCTCGENKAYAVHTTLEDRGVKVGIAIAAKVTSGFTRGGMLTTRRYVIRIRYPGRDPFDITNYQRTPPLLSKAQMQAKLAGLAMKISPDGKHLALKLDPFDKVIRFVHLMPKSWPFNLEAFDKKLGLTKLSDVDWNKIGSPLQLATQSFRKFGSNKEFCILSDLGVTLHNNLDSEPVADAVVELWPDCQDSHSMVTRLVTDATLAKRWRGPLLAKIATYLDSPKHTPQGLRGVVELCRTLKETTLRQKAIRAAVPHWPKSYDVHEWIFMMGNETLPADVKAALTKRAKATLADPKALAHEKQMAQKILHRVGR